MIPTTDLLSGGERYRIVDLDRLDLVRLPWVHRVLIENLVRHDEDIPGIHRTKWKLPYCRYLPHEDPRITISAYLKALTGMPLDVAMLAVPVGRKNETTLYFHANLDSPPPVLNLPPNYDHAWLSPEQLNVSPYFADGVDIEALATAKPPWPGTEAT